MPLEATYLAAFLVGLLGGVHCVGMCGGIVGALTLGLPAAARVRPGASLAFLLAYNAGRIASYTLAGLLMGGLGQLAAELLAVHQAQRVLQAVAGLFMIALGLYLGGWSRVLLRVEQAGGRLWRYVQPLGRGLLPVRSPAHALALGLVWGWLPCGLVYSVLIWSIAAGSAVQGGLLMLSFGLGTLPNLLAMGVFAASLTRLVQRPGVRAAAGLLVAGYGIWMLLRALV